MALREQMIETARKWVQAHDRNTNRNADITALTTPDFVAFQGPRSLETPEFHRDDYIAFQSQAFAIFDSYGHKEVEMVVDESQHKVVYYLDVEATAAGGKVNYASQYIQKLVLTEDGKLIKEFHTFLDSEKFFALIESVQAASR